MWPDDQVNEETLFKTGEGYRTALNGVYKDLSVTSLYGREMTWGFLDVLAQCYDSWSINSGHIYDKALSYKYQDKEIKSLIQSIWSNSYNAVANCNNLIDRAQKEDPSKFAEGEEERNLIWGEALALRAFIHFDMLRLFAPSTGGESSWG
ncbi:MAG: RagB/SusD family nutrient uptake outer membrane protein [Butyricimonas faecihominis]